MGRRNLGRPTRDARTGGADPRRAARTKPLRGGGSSVDLVKEGRVAQAVYWMHAAAWWREVSFDWDVAPTPAGPARRATYGAINLLGIDR